MPLLADIDFGRLLAPALTAMVVPLVLTWLFRSAQAESIANAGQRKIAYPKAMKIFVITCWMITVPFALLFGFGVQNADVSYIPIFVLCWAALLLPLHLEIFGVLITWDGTNIYTQSPWRKRRTIPLSSVQACDYSPAMQWYRISTTGHGIVRLHQLCSGIPELLRALPCRHPGYPPRLSRT